MILQKYRKTIEKTKKAYTQYRKYIQAIVLKCLLRENSMYINNDLINEDFLKKIKDIRGEKDNEGYEFTIDDYNHVNSLIRIQNILLEALNKLSRVYTIDKIKKIFDKSEYINWNFYERDSKTQK